VLVKSIKGKHENRQSFFPSSFIFTRSPACERGRVSCKTMGILLTPKSGVCAMRRLPGLHLSRGAAAKGKRDRKDQRPVTSLFQYIIINRERRQDCYIRTLDSGERAASERRRTKSASVQNHSDLCRVSDCEFFFTFLLL
jgi:hypothetical protein